MRASEKDIAFVVPLCCRVQRVRLRVPVLWSLVHQVRHGRVLRRRVRRRVWRVRYGCCLRCVQRSRRRARRGVCERRRAVVLLLVVRLVTAARCLHILHAVVLHVLCVEKRVHAFVAHESVARVVVHHEVCGHADHHEIDLAERNEQADRVHHDRVHREDLHDHNARRLPVRNVQVLVVLYRVCDKRADTVAREVCNARAHERVQRDASPLGPRVELEPEQDRARIRAKRQERAVVVDHDAHKDDTDSDSPACDQ